MKLFYHPPSPYVRKVLIVACEKGLMGRLDLIRSEPWPDPSDLLAATPLAKVPALLLEDGRLLPESTIICQYLDMIGHGPRLVPKELYIDVLARAALAQGLTDAAYAIVLERRRPTDQQDQHWIDRQRRAIARTLPRLTVDAARFDLGDITLASGLAYLNFRLPEIDWRQQHPKLAAWFDQANGRASMQSTSFGAATNQTTRSSPT